VQEVAYLILEVIFEDDPEIQSMARAIKSTSPHGSKQVITNSDQEERMAESVYPPASKELAQKRRELTPNIQAAWEAFSKMVFADGALPAKSKQLIAVAVAHVTQCPYCIHGHTKNALRHGATPQEIMEAIWVAAEMRAGGAYAHSLISLDSMNEEHRQSA
jgi:AhpD family alkylhydroperoxidase